MNKITVISVSEVDFDQVANQFSLMDSEVQAVFLSALFSSLHFQCDGISLFHKQLSFIADDIKKNNSTNLIFAIETLGEYLKKEN